MATIMQGIYAGLDTSVIKSWLTAAQNAYAQLQNGQSVASASYAQGDGGSKSVTYRTVDGPALLAQIEGYLRILGYPPLRRAIRPAYSGGYRHGYRRVWQT